MLLPLFGFFNGYPPIVVIVGFVVTGAVSSPPFLVIVVVWFGKAVDAFL